MQEFDRLWQIVKQLRNPHSGCPWDIKQTPKSLIPNFIEELYEVIEAIENKDDQHLKEELGDLTLHILMQARIAEENGDFKLCEVFKTISEKLISRHPHVFNNERGKTIEAEQVKNNWEKIKNRQKNRDSILDGIPKVMPALIYAQRMQEKAASVGFDWDKMSDVIAKVDEELQELKEAINAKDKQAVEEETGDLIFAIVNFARKNGLDSESVLKQAADKFYTRFRWIEDHFREKNLNIYETTLELLDELWEESKKSF